MCAESGDVTFESEQEEIPLTEPATSVSEVVYGPL